MTRRRRRPDRRGQARERLFRDGTRALSDAELLEILLRNGCPGSTTKQLARELLAEYGSLIGLSGVDRAFLHRHGIGRAKAATIIAAFEIARRVAKERMPRRDLLDRPDAVACYLSLRYSQGDQETMGALFLDVRNRLIGETNSLTDRCLSNRIAVGRRVTEPTSWVSRGKIRAALKRIPYTRQHTQRRRYQKPQRIRYCSHRVQVIIRARDESVLPAACVTELIDDSNRYLAGERLEGGARRRIARQPASGSTAPSAGNASTAWL